MANSDLFSTAGSRLTSPKVSFWVPGRIELLGKHTDYCGGRSLLCAVDRGFAVCAEPLAPNSDVEILTAFPNDPNTTLRVALPLSPTVLQQDIDQLRASKSWALYPAIVLHRLLTNFSATTPFRISVACNLPPASGMSTSSAVVCYMWLVVSFFNKLQESPKYKQFFGDDEGKLYTYLGNCENGRDFIVPSVGVLEGSAGVGTFGGSEDHTAIMSGSEGEIKMWSFAPTTHISTASLPPSVTFVIAVSGAMAEKTKGAMSDYNDAAMLALYGVMYYCVGVDLDVDVDDFAGTTPPSNFAEVIAHSKNAGNRNVRNCVSQKIREGYKSPDAAGIIRKIFPSLEPPAADSKITSEDVVTRWLQFYDESEVLVPSALAAFASSNWDDLGRIVDSSHSATVSKLQNTIPETAWLPEEARRLGAIASSAFGAGFGGSCYALVLKEDAREFKRKWEEAYASEFPIEGGEGRLPRLFFETGASAGASKISHA